MSVQVEPSQLRFLASRFSSGAQEIRTKATRLDNIMNDLVGPSWNGEGAHAFAVKCEIMKDDLQKAADVLDRAVEVLNRFAYLMERVNQLRSQANMLEQQSWSYSGDSIDDLHHRQNLARQAAQLRHEAEWEANAADAQAASEFHSIMATIPQILDQINQYTGVASGTGELDDLPEPMRSYYLRHRDLLEDGTEQDTIYTQDREQLLEAIRQYYMAKKADYLSENDRTEATEEDMKYMYDLTNKQLYDRLQDFVRNDEQFDYYVKLVQQPDFDAKEQLKHDQNYKRFVVNNVAANEGPAGFAVMGMTFAAGIVKALQPRYSADRGAMSGENRNEDQEHIEPNAKESEDIDPNQSSIEESEPPLQPQFVPRDTNDNPLTLPRTDGTMINGTVHIPASLNPHTQIGWQKGRKGDYIQTLEWGENGIPVKRTDWTDHGRPQNHTNPHDHPAVLQDGSWSFK